MGSIYADPKSLIVPILASVACAAAVVTVVVRYCGRKYGPLSPEEAYSLKLRQIDKLAEVIFKNQNWCLSPTYSKKHADSANKQMALEKALKLLLPADPKRYQGIVDYLINTGVFEKCKPMTVLRQMIEDVNDERAPTESETKLIPYLKKLGDIVLPKQHRVDQQNVEPKLPVPEKKSKPNYLARFLRRLPGAKK